MVVHSLGACNFPHRISTPSTLQRTMPTPRRRGERLELPKTIEYNKLHLQIPSEEKTISFKKPLSIDNTHQLDKAFNCHKSKSATFFLIIGIQTFKFYVFHHSPIGGSLLTSLFTFLLICIRLYLQKEIC